MNHVGVMVVPVGQEYSQELMVYKKAAEKMIGKTICGVSGFLAFYTIKDKLCYSSCI